MTINANQIGERESKTPTDSPLVLNNALSALSKPCDRKAESQPNTSGCPRAEVPCDVVGPRLFSLEDGLSI